MKIIFRILVLILLIILINSCKKDKPTIPIITTTDVTEISYTTATSGGEVTNGGGAPIVSRGVCWNTSGDPTTADSITIEDGGLGSFTSNITNLTPNTMYYVRAYAINSAGTGYGNEVSFTTTLAIGVSYQGGIVAYILQPGDPGHITGQTHGLIAAPTDQSRGIAWWNGIFNVYTYTDATAIGTGNANTNIIVSVQGGGSYAAKMCYDLVLGGYSDWFLPSRDELLVLYFNNAAIGGFNNGGYWSSSETWSDYYHAMTAWTLNFGWGNQYGGQKFVLGNVRAVRSF